MLFLSDPVQQPDPIALAMVAVLAVIFTIYALCRARNKKQAAQAASAPAVASPRKAPTAPGVAGQLKLHDVDPKIAAMAMAIVADHLGKPVNELRFISIKEVS